MASRSPRCRPFAAITAFIYYGVSSLATRDIFLDRTCTALAFNLLIYAVIVAILRARALAMIPNPMKWSHPAGDSILAVVESRGVSTALREYNAARVTNPRIDSLPDFAFSLVGEKLIGKGRLPDAITFYETMAETRRSPLFRAVLGEAYLKAGRTDQALAQFEIVAKTDSLNTGVREWIRVLRKP